MKEVEAKANRLLRESFLDKQLRAFIVLSVVGLKLKQGQEFTEKRRKLNRLFDSMISRVANQGGAA